MPNIAEQTAKMRAYFKDCRDKAVLPVKEIKRAEKPIASEGGLCIYLGISKDELRSMQQGTDEERRFYGQYQLEYEITVDVMRSANLLPDQVYKELKAGFNKATTSEDKNIVLSFPDFNAPDDWEDYKALRAVLEENGLTVKQGIMLVRKVCSK